MTEKNQIQLKCFQSKWTETKCMIFEFSNKKWFQSNYMKLNNSMKKRKQKTKTKFIAMNKWK